ncbi:hypothetical protein CPB83DRAFT_885295 [Crepidotus variabilis]|uniref:Uncharacterized protein n=1 Tax=Crepidotus variabilis TaxID=179855 RepID=A0A9P6EBA2_9AGAR|nr:hypothetical protein CPB83DRAFT_885295 [Crepidotus variabilis]
MLVSGFKSSLDIYYAQSVYKTIRSLRLETAPLIYPSQPHIFKTQTIMTLNGRFTIKGTSAQKLIGRAYIQDESLNPKEIVLRSDNGQTPVFDLKTSGDRTEIKIDGGRTANIHNKLFAVLAPEEPTQTWKIEEISQGGGRKYIIMNDDHQGWTLSEEAPESQIDIRPIVSTKSIPPQHLPGQVWEITPA